MRGSGTDAGSCEIRETFDAVGHEFGMFDDVRRVADDAGHDLLPVGKLHVLPHPPLVFVTDVGGLERVRPGVDVEHGFDEVLELEIGGVRAVPTAPAQMEADPVLGQTPQA